MEARRRKNGVVEVGPGFSVGLEGLLVGLFVGLSVGEVEDAGRGGRQTEVAL